MAAASPMRPPCAWEPAGQCARCTTCACVQAAPSGGLLEAIAHTRQQAGRSGRPGKRSKECAGQERATRNGKQSGRDEELLRTTLIKSPAAASALVACAGTAATASVACFPMPHTMQFAPARLQAPQPCAFRTAYLTSCAAWQAKATATLGPALWSDSRGGAWERLSVRAPALVAAELDRARHSRTAALRLSCTGRRKVTPPSPGLCISPLTSSRAVDAGGGAAAACSLDMEEAGLGTTLPPQQWSGFERFKEVQEILDRNKCAAPVLQGCLGTWRLGSRTLRLLINEINANHESKQYAPLCAQPSERRFDANVLAATRREDLQRNVVLIRELNINIGKVVELYRELSVRCGGSAAQLLRLLGGSPSPGAQFCRRSWRHGRTVNTAELCFECICCTLADVSAQPRAHARDEQRDTHDDNGEPRAGADTGGQRLVRRRRHSRLRGRRRCAGSSLDCWARALLLSHLPGW